MWLVIMGFSVSKCDTTDGGGGGGGCVAGGGSGGGGGGSDDADASLIRSAAVLVKVAQSTRVVGLLVAIEAWWACHCCSSSHWRHMASCVLKIENG